MTTKPKKTPSWKRDHPPVSKLDAKELAEIREWIKSNDFKFWKTGKTLPATRRDIAKKYKKKIGNEQLKKIILEVCELWKQKTCRRIDPKPISLDGIGWHELSLAVKSVSRYAECVESVSDVALLVNSVARFKCNERLLDGMRDCHKWWLKK